MINQTTGNAVMLTQLKISFRRCQPVLLQDGLGLAALMVMLLVALHLPDLI